MNRRLWTPSGSRIVTPYEQAWHDLIKQVSIDLDTNTHNRDQAIFRNYTDVGRIPNPYPATYMWTKYVDVVTPAFYTTYMAWGDTGPVDYYVAFNSALHSPEDYAIGVRGTESFSSVGIISGRQMTQALRAVYNGSQTTVDYFWDLPNLARKITAVWAGTLANTSGHSLWFGSNPWTIFEGVDGKVGDIKIWQQALSDGAIAKESSSRWPVVNQYKQAVWAVVPCHTLQDLRDYSGNGRHFRAYGAFGSTPTTGAPFWKQKNQPLLQEHDTNAPAGGGGGGGTNKFFNLLGVGMLARASATAVAVSQLKEPMDRRQVFKTLLATALCIKR